MSEAAEEIEKKEPELAELEGVLDRISYSGRGGFIIGLVIAGKTRETIKGVLPEGVHEGDDLKLLGRWAEDKKYGKQFDFVSVQLAVPKAASGIRKWLARHIDGIGDRAAEILVERFGVDAPKILEPIADSSADPLLDLPGMTDEKAARARESYAALGSDPAMSRWLAEHGIVGAFAGRLVARYKGETKTVLTSEPYLPIKDVDGFGFKRCDEFAKKLGVKDHDPRRAKAAILFAFDMQAQEGHVWLSDEELERELAKEFHVPIEATKEARRQLVYDGAIVEEGRTATRLYTKTMRDAEVDICFDLLRIVAAGKLLDPLEPVPDERLNPEQQDAVFKAAKHAVLGITGGPGTGKSHTLKAILAQVDPLGRALLMAPTGKAAKRMTQATGVDASTIHRALEYGPHPEHGGLGFQRNRKNKLLQRVIVVDEASMVDTEIAAALLAAIPDGARLIIVGDVDQLPSVGPGTVLKDILECELVPVVRLHRNMRSAEGGAIATCAHKVIAGERIDEVDLEGDVRLLLVENAATVASEIVRLVAGGPGAIEGYAREQVQVLCPQRVGPIGSNALNLALQAKLNPLAPGAMEIDFGDTKFRPGDKVQVTKNEYDLEVFNGDTGVIDKVDDGAVSKKRRIAVKLDDGRRVVFEKEHLKLLQLAYAISVHKSQGSEYPVVVIPVHSSNSFMLFRNLLYTALTRAREKVWMVGERKALARAIRNQSPNERNTSLWARIRHLAENPDKVRPAS